MEDYEKLGAFYLGQPFDLATAKRQPGLVLYDAKDLVTHAVCVGMTGSGKTGLCIGLLEEAAIDGIPSIVIDPKGDLSNLLLTFPQLRGEDFRPWINEEDAQRKGLSPDEFAQQQADLWKKGLADWRQDGERIARLRDAAEFRIYTPGSKAGIPVSILKSFDVPSTAVLDDSELLQDQINTTVTGLLGLVGVESDAMTGREHILLSTILATSWKGGKNLDLASLIQQIQNPPVQRVGVMDVESFFPQKDRFALAMRLNNLLAAPGFENWLNGEPLDVSNFLHSGRGKPRVSIFSIGHLGDAERMFFVSLLLNQILGWTRAQSGTTSLRAIVYMDEIFGYFPPVANPPSKQPLLTLLKQARAFGVGVVLATQNPVDLDYKGLANAGTWFIGRLQTDRDKQRVLDGLEGAAANASSKFDRSTMEQTLAGLGSRVFLMNNVHEDEPVVFQTRWTLSYLRGPLTRNQIRQLAERDGAAMKTDASEAEGTTDERSAVSSQSKPQTAATARPILPPQVPQYFIPVRSVAPAGATLVYHPRIFGSVDVFFSDSKSGESAQQQSCRLAALADGPLPLDWNESADLDLQASDLEKDSREAGASFAPVPTQLAQAKEFDGWAKSLGDAIYRTAKLELLRSEALKLVSKPGESERDFRVRLSQIAREQRDAEIEKLRQKYAPKAATLAERIRKAEMAKQVQAQQATQSKWQAAMTIGASILGGLPGRKKMSTANVNRAATAARGVGRTMKESSDVARADENVAAVQQQLTDLNSQLETEINECTLRFNATGESLEKIPLRPKKTDVKVRLVALAWTPVWQSPSGETPAWE
ncbi:ATP-binding protein [soil metagenome]